MSGLAAAMGRVALLYGGHSAEREVSLKSGAAVLAALRSEGVDVTAIDCRQGAVEQLQAGGFDRAFIALHGPGGEDGSIQGLLDWLQIPYTGSGVMASSLGMDKVRCKQLWRGVGLPTAQFATLTADSDWAQCLAALGGAAMVKPAQEGSSIGMARVDSAAGLEAAWRGAAHYDGQELAEALLPGPEYTVSIVGRQVLPAIHIEVAGSFYDYSAKYLSDTTQYHCPAAIPAPLAEQLSSLALAAFDAIGCRGWGRVDLMCDQRGAPQLLEVNTVPGMTDHSLVPMAAAAAGLNFSQLVMAILSTTLDGATGGGV
jgi:D-alanine-D-alanine ligase